MTLPPFLASLIICNRAYEEGSDQKIIFWRFEYFVIQGREKSNGLTEEKKMVGLAAVLRKDGKEGNLVLLI